MHLTKKISRGWIQTYSSIQYTKNGFKHFEKKYNMKKIFTQQGKRNNDSIKRR